MRGANSNGTGNGLDRRVYRTLSAALGVDETELTDDSSPESVPAWDSLNHLNVILAMESEFGIELSAEDAFAMSTVARIRDVLRTYGVEV